MKTKEQLLKQLRELEKKEQADKEKQIKQKNYKKFKERESDWFIGKAHADLDFISKRNSSDKELPLLPVTVSITGNCGTIFRGVAPVTSSTHTFFRNVWDTNYTFNEREFQQKVNAFVQKEVNKICRQLPVVLEMMGLQMINYRVNKINFPENKINEIKKDIENEQAKILNNYKDKEFLTLIREQHGWKNDKGEEVPPFKDVDLSHSNMILYRYIFKYRPELQDKFKETRFYKTWKGKIR